MLKLLLRLIFLFTVSQIDIHFVLSQNNYDFFTKPKKANSSFLSLEIENSNFVKNNEYFNDFAEGYTLFGYFITPKIIAKPTDNLEIGFGFFYNNYFGSEEDSKIEPVLRLKYKPNNNLQIIFGKLDGTINHNLPESILNTEKYLTNNIEKGLQVLYNNSYISTDLWINWKKHIFRNSDYPEEFIAGNSTTLKLIRRDSSEESNDPNFLNFKIAGIASHIGGQIDTCNVQVESIVNALAGWEFYPRISDNSNSAIKLYLYFHTSLDISPEKKLAYDYGFGNLSGVRYNYHNLEVVIEYWMGKHYFNQNGMPIYNSISYINPNYTAKKRELIVSHLFWNHQQNDYVKFGIGSDFYYDLLNKSLDYSFGIYLRTFLDYKLLEKSPKKD